MPAAIIKSASAVAKLAATVPCIPSIPRLRSSSLGNTPSPNKVVVTGIFAFLANSLKSSVEPDFKTPAPAIINGFLAFLIRLIAVLICFGCPSIVGTYPGRSKSMAQSFSNSV